MSTNYFRLSDLRELLIEWNIPMDLYEPLSKYYTFNPNLTWKITQNNMIIRSNHGLGRMDK